MKKILTALLTAIMLLNLNYVGYTAEDYTFEVSGYTTPASVRQTVDSALRETGTGNKPVYYKYSRRPEELSNDLFAECYTYLCHGTGEKITDVNKNMLTFNFSLPVAGVTENDTVYFSFWYRSDSSFTGMDSETYNGTEQTPLMMFCSNDVPVYELSSADTSLLKFVADDNWHKVEYYVPLTNEIFTTLNSNVSSYQFRLSFFDLDCAAKIQFAGMKCGVLKLNNAEAITNKKAATYLGKALTKGILGTLKVNDNNISVSKGVDIYNVSADTAENIIIEAENIITGGRVDTIKENPYEYKMNVFSPGYDEKLPSDAERTYIKFVSENGEFDENASALVYNVKNSEHYSVFTVFIDVKNVSAKLKVKDTETNLLDGCVTGDKITLETTYTNHEAKEMNCVAVVVIKKGNDIEELYSFKTSILPADNTKTEKYEVLLGDKDYTGYTSDYYIIDLTTFADIIK